MARGHTIQSSEIINDGEYHTYTIDWHAGGDGELPRVIWLKDKKKSIGMKEMNSVR